MGDCKKCFHFRVPKHSTSKMQESITVQSSEISTVFDELIKLSENMRGQEANEKVANAGRGEWEKKPQTFSYCGFLESEKRYYIHEVKNLGGRCKDYTEGSPLNNSCKNCRHRIIPNGYKQKRRNLDFILINSKPGSSSVTNKLKDINMLIANEIRIVYFTNGVLNDEPFIYEYCNIFSNPSDRSYVICALKNPNNNCPAFEPQLSSDI